MDKETSERLVRLEIEQAVQKERESWEKLIYTTLLKTVTRLLGVGLIGLIYGWHLPENLKKAILRIWGEE